MNIYKENHVVSFAQARVLMSNAITTVTFFLSRGSKWIGAHTTHSTICCEKKILSVLSIKKHDHIITMLRQVYVSTTTSTQYCGLSEVTQTSPYYVFT